MQRRSAVVILRNTDEFSRCSPQVEQPVTLANDAESIVVRTDSGEATPPSRDFKGESSV